MNDKFRSCLAECKQLNSAGLLRQTGATADKILYNHAIQMVIGRPLLFREFFFFRKSLKCKRARARITSFIPQCQSAALDELFGNPAECFQRYHTAQILLHSLSQHVSHSQDRALLIKCK